MKIKVSATMVPPPEFMREGVKPTQFEGDTVLDELPQFLTQFTEMVMKVGSFHVGGSVAFLVQPVFTKEERRTALETGGTG